jgi:hypothetical protein
VWSCQFGNKAPTGIDAYPISDPPKGMYWNSIGVSDLAKHRYIVDAIKERNPDFVAIMESGK